jgi:hypothetical protein
LSYAFDYCKDKRKKNFKSISEMRNKFFGFI